MQLPLILKPIAVGAIAVSMGIIGCTQQTGLNAQAEPNIAQTTQTAPPAGQTEQREPDVPYVPTPQEVVDEMLKLAKVQKGDVLYDLGSGDGRIPITAVREYGVKSAVGIDINPERIEEANENAKKAGVSDRVQFLNQDLFKSNFNEASVVTLYLLPDINVKLRPQLFKQLKPGTRIVSHDFDMGEWKPERTVQVQGPNRTHTLYYWVVPEKPPANLQG
ncbi:SAM-dependent methyltransferase [Chroococcidiopsis sp.]|uniref:SAM-dependent methyltransferase n=1 Tax=Chroococcidiopsis sp. TaxID=3088168 RepID=UPI003F2A7044